MLRFSAVFSEPQQTTHFQFALGSGASLAGDLSVLEQLGHRVLAVGDGRRGLELLKMGDLDLIMVDGRMPIMDGPEMIRTLRALPGPAASLPVVAGTGGDAEEVEAMTLAGADAVLRKPVTVTAVARAVADAAAGRDRRVPSRAVA